MMDHKAERTFVLSWCVVHHFTLVNFPLTPAPVTSTGFSVNTLTKWKRITCRVQSTATAAQPSVNIYHKSYLHLGINFVEKFLLKN